MGSVERPCKPLFASWKEQYSALGQPKQCFVKTNLPPHLSYNYSASKDIFLDYSGSMCESSSGFRIRVGPSIRHCAQEGINASF